MRSINLFAILLFTTLLAVAQKKPTGAADIILFNGRVWTGNEKATFKEAVAIGGNSILQTGSSAEIKKLAGPHTNLIDLHGKLVTAGINDAHIHFLEGSLGLTGIDLYESKTLNDALAAIESFVKKNPEKKWITGMGWQYSIFQGGMPTKEALQQLNKIVNDRPVYIDAYDGHSIWVNSKTMEMAGVTRDTKFEGFGSIIKDAKGEPTGAITEGARSIVSKIIPPPTTEEKLAALREGMKYAAAHGITSIQNASGSVEDFSLYETLLKKKNLPCGLLLLLAQEKKQPKKIYNSLYS